MHIYIPSKSRADKQQTVAAMPPAVHKKITVVVPESEASEYTEALPAGASVLPVDDDMRIPEVRQFILEHHLAKHASKGDPKLVMMDDDLKFFERRKDKPGRFTTLPAPSKRLIDLLVQINAALDLYPHVGVCPREQGHRFPPHQTFLVRMVRVLGYDANVLRDEGVRFDRIPLMEDFDAALQLITRGYATCMVTSFSQGQKNDSNAEGGCSTYRNPEMQREAAEGLAELHPSAVKTVEKKTKSGWFEGGVRTDVRVQWQAAYEEGLKYRNSLGDEEE